MGLRDLLFKMATFGLDKVDRDFFPKSFSWGSGRAQWNGWDFRKYATEGYMGNPYIFSAITQRQTAMSRIKVYAVTIDGKGNEVDLPPTHPVHNLLRRPSERFPSWPSWVKAMVGYKMIGGSAFALAIGPTPFGTPKPRPPLVLHPIGLNSMAVRGGSRIGMIDGFTYKDADGKETNYLPNEVFWWNSFNPMSEWSGLSVMKPGEKSIEMNNSARDYNKSILDNGGFPGSVLTTDDHNFRKPQADEVKKDLKEGYTGASTAGKWLILWGGLKPYKFGMTPQEMGFESLLKISAIEAALITQTPPELLGDASQKTFANYREAVLAFYTGTVIPEEDELLGSLSIFVSERFGQPIIVKQDLDSIDALAALREEAKASVREDFKAMIIKRSEAREAGGYTIEEKDPTMEEYFSGTLAPTILQAKNKSWSILSSKAEGKACGHAGKEKK